MLGQRARQLRYWLWSREYRRRRQLAALMSLITLSLVVGALLARVLNPEHVHGKVVPTGKHLKSMTRREPLEPFFAANASAGKIPWEWERSFNREDLAASQMQADIWAKEVRAEAVHTWKGYKERAWGADEVMPESGRGRDYCHLSVMMLDSLSTLWVMGLHDEFNEAKKHLEHTSPLAGEWTRQMARRSEPHDWDRRLYGLGRHGRKRHGHREEGLPEDEDKDGDAQNNGAVEEEEPRKVDRADGDDEHAEESDTQEEEEDSAADYEGVSGNGMVPVVKVTTRALGGLLSAYSLTGDQIFITRAREVADHLMPAFPRRDSGNGLPDEQINIQTGETQNDLWWEQDVRMVAHVGTLQLEFRYLAHANKTDRYRKVVDKVTDYVLAAHNAAGLGLVPTEIWATIEPHFTLKYMTSKEGIITLGNGADTYYEYLLKQYIQTGRVEERFVRPWVRAMREMKQRLLTRTPTGLTFLPFIEDDKFKYEMEHLTCSLPGQLMLGSRMIRKHGQVSHYRDDFLKELELVAAQLTETCYEMYRRSPNGLAPDTVKLRQNSKGSDFATGDLEPKDKKNSLRPETVEALYYMHYFTGDPKYRRMGYEIFQAFRNNSKTQFGYGATYDVTADPPVLLDEQESFWMAETLKYLYLLFSPPAALSLDEFVLNTEGQPMRIWKGTPTADDEGESVLSGGTHYLKVIAFDPVLLFFLFGITFVCSVWWYGTWQEKREKQRKDGGDEDDP